MNGAVGCAMSGLKRGDPVMLNEDGVRWIVANPKLHDRWRNRRGVIEGNSKNGWHRVRWEGNKSSNESMPAKFLRLEAVEAAA